MQTVTVRGRDAVDSGFQQILMRMRLWLRYQPQPPTECDDVFAPINPSGVSNLGPA